MSRSCQSRRRFAADVTALPLLEDPPWWVITARTGRQVDGLLELIAELRERSTLRG